jgi:hypothetical protein
MNPHPVAPAAAVGQTNFVSVVPILQHTRIRGRILASTTQSVSPLSAAVKRRELNMCKFVHSGQIRINNLEEFLKEKEGFKKQQKADRCRERHGTKRRQNGTYSEF